MRYRQPVDLITGRKVIPDELDFSLPGLMPIERHCYSHNRSAEAQLRRL
jgi:hypothetical protein